MLLVPPILRLLEPMDVMNPSSSPLPTQHSPASDIDGAFPISVSGEDLPGRGQHVLEDTLVEFMMNPAFKGAREGVFHSGTRVRLEQGAAGEKPRIIVLGVELMAFDPDEASIAREAFALIRSSDLVKDIEQAPAAVIEHVTDGHFRRRSDFLSLHVAAR